MQQSAVIEVIASTVRDCLEIEKGGAHRIELVSALEVGGLTPSYGLIRRAREATTLPINVMIRPHSLSFTYDLEDQETMLQDIDKCKELKLNGVVFGVLDSNQQIDVQNSRLLMDRAQGLEITFHKAFDKTETLVSSLHTLESLSTINRVLTQGGTQPILDNLEMLKQLTTHTSKKILLGGGLHHSNFRLVRKNLPNCEYHFGTAVRVNDRVSSELVAELIKLSHTPL